MGLHDLAELLASRELGLVDADLARTVRATLQAVHKNGGRAAHNSARKFDCPTLTKAQFLVSGVEMADASVSADEERAIDVAIERVQRFHQQQLDRLTQGWVKRETGGWQWREPVRPNEPSTGTEGQRLMPLQRVGVYVPGGKADYPSSVIMNAVPALVAGVPDVFMCTPADEEGHVSAAVLVAARKLGIRSIAKVGGAAAIGLMAFGHGGWLPANIPGTRTPLAPLPVDKIVGPGNRYVTEAKRQVWGVVGLDGFAGPSEVCVVADGTVSAKAAAIDWLTQVEHAPDNEGILITHDRGVAEAIMREAEALLARGGRQSIMRQALAERGAVVVTASRQDALKLAGIVASEHVSLLVEDPEAALNEVRFGGCFALGEHTPQSAGDYVSGPSHTLPTSRSARFGSPVNVMDFLQFQSVSQYTTEDLASLAGVINTFGKMEGLPMHRYGALGRQEA